MSICLYQHCQSKRQFFTFTFYYIYWYKNHDLKKMPALRIMFKRLIWPQQLLSEPTMQIVLSQTSVPKNDLIFLSSPGFLLVSDEVLSMDAAALEEDLAMLATTTPHNSGSWDSANLARAGQGKTLWIGEYDLCILSSDYLRNSVLKCKCNPQKGGVLKISDALFCQCTMR